MCDTVAFKDKRQYLHIWNRPFFHRHKHTKTSTVVMVWMRSAFQSLQYLNTGTSWQRSLGRWCNLDGGKHITSIGFWEFRASLHLQFTPSASCSQGCSWRCNLSVPWSCCHTCRLLSGWFSAWNHMPKLTLFLKLPWLHCVIKTAGK